MKRFIFIVGLLLSGSAFAATPTITINNTTGSNTAASGAGPSTAVSGSGASTTATSQVVDLSADTPDLSGVATDGTAVLYVNSTSGKKFSKIQAVNDGADTVTTEGTWAVTEASRGWGIGGKRLDFHSTSTNTRALFIDALAGWTIDIESTGTSYQVNPTITLSGGGTTDYFTIRGTTSTSFPDPPVITSSVNAVALFTQAVSAAVRYNFENLKFTHTGGTKGNGYTSSGVNVNTLKFKKIYCDTMNICINGADVDGGLSIEDSTIINSVTNGIAGVSADGFFVHGCYIRNSGSVGITFAGTSVQIHLIGNVIADSGSHGFFHTALSRNPRYVVYNNTFAGNDASGFTDDNGTSGGPRLPLFANNIFWGNGVYGIDWSEPLVDTKHGMPYTNRNNFQGSNTSGYQTGLEDGVDLVTLTRDPFVNAASGDYRLNAASGGGAEIRAAGFPGTFFGTTLISYVDGGGVASQRKSAAGAVSH